MLELILIHVNKGDSGTQLISVLYYIIAGRAFVVAKEVLSWKR